MTSRPFARLVSTIVLSASLALGTSAAAQDENVPRDTAEIQAQQAAVAPGSVPLTVNFDPQADLENILYLDLSTGERVPIRLMPEWAPNTVERVKTLKGFYDGVIFHRVIDGFMAQTGDPTGTGRGGSELPDLAAEFNMLPHVRGTVSMARSEAEDSANSQFFIVFYPRFALDRNYTNFGRVIGNMGAVDAIERGEPPAQPTYIVQASIAADQKPQAFPAAEPAPAATEITADMLSNSPSD
jgi:peptidylprolyl isomerase